MKLAIAGLAVAIGSGVTTWLWWGATHRLVAVDGQVTEWAPAIAWAPPLLSAALAGAVVVWAGTAWSATRRTQAVRQVAGDTIAAAEAERDAARTAAADARIGQAEARQAAAMAVAERDRLAGALIGARARAKRKLGKR